MINELVELKDNITVQSGNIEGDLQEMLCALTEELIEKSQILFDAKQEKSIPISFMNSLKEWQEYMDAYCEVIRGWMNLDFITIKKCKYFEEMEDLMADLDDFIDTFNELYEVNNLQLGYMENWDIGIFF